MGKSNVQNGNRTSTNSNRLLNVFETIDLFLTEDREKKLADALIALASDKEMRARAESLGTHIRSQDGVDRAVQIFQREIVNFPPRVISWRIMVTTGKGRLGGGASVFLTLFGERGHTEEFLLYEGRNFLHAHLFKRGMTSEFTTVHPDIGNIRKIKIRHDAKGILHNDWFLEKITLIPHTTNQPITFICNEWLSKTLGDRKLEKELSPGV